MARRWARSAVEGEDLRRVEAERGIWRRFLRQRHPDRLTRSSTRCEPSDSTSRIIGQRRSVGTYPRGGSSRTLTRLTPAPTRHLKRPSLPVRPVCPQSPAESLTIRVTSDTAAPVSSNTTNTMLASGSVVGPLETMSRHAWSGIARAAGTSRGAGRKSADVLACGYCAPFARANQSASVPNQKLSTFTWDTRLCAAKRQTCRSQDDDHRNPVAHHARRPRIRATARVERASDARSHD